MKKFVTVFVVALLVLCSCAAPASEKGGFFSYQDSEINTNGTLSVNGNEYYVSISMSAPDENGVRSDIRIEFTKPEEIAGFAIIKKGTEEYVEMGELKVPVSADALVSLSGIEKLFSLTSELISGIESDANGINTAILASKELTGEVKTDTSGAPISIVLRYTDGSFVSFATT